MRVQNKKRKVETSKSRRGSEGRRKPPRSVHASTSQVETVKVESELVPDLDMEWLREGNTRAEQKEIEALTDRVFDSVLRRCGWRQDEDGKIEHSGRS